MWHNSNKSEEVNESENKNKNEQDQEHRKDNQDKIKYQLLKDDEDDYYENI